MASHSDITLEQIQAALAAQLPRAQQADAPQIAALLYKVTEGELTPEQAQSQLNTIQPLLEKIAGRPVQPLLDFGDHNTFNGEINIGDVAFGSILKLNVNQHHELSIAVNVHNPTWQENLQPFFDFVAEHRFLFITSIVLAPLTVVAWAQFTDRFLIPLWVLVAGLLALEACLLFTDLTLTRPLHRLPFALLAGVALVALLGLTGHEYWTVMYPAKFAAHDFGVAVAQFGEGPEFSSTLKARDVSSVVTKHLQDEVAHEPDLRFVKIRPVGLVRNKEEAAAEGQRIGADLVIWGNLQATEDHTILNFSILETPDKVSNPMFPRVVPLYDSSADGTIMIGSRDSGEIAKNAQALSSFIFGLAHFFEWDFGSAARAFEAAPTVSGEEKSAYYYLLHFYHGLALQGVGRLDEADVEFQKASAIIENKDHAPQVARSFGYNSQGRNAEAQVLARAARQFYTSRLQTQEDDYISYYNRALTNELIKDYRAALADYQKTIEKEPDYYIAHIGQVRMLLTLRQLPESITAAQDAIKLAESKGGNPAWAWLYLAKAHQLGGSTAEARTAYVKATQLAPDVDYIHLQAAEFYANSGDPADLPIAEQTYKNLIKISSNRASAHNLLGRFYRDQNQMRQALNEYDAAVQAAPEQYGLLEERAGVLDKLGKTEAARQDFLHALQLQPQRYNTRVLYGNFLFGQEQWQMAINEWERARSINPGYCGLDLMLGMGYLKIGDPQRAKEMFQYASGDAGCQAAAARELENLNP